MVGGSQLNRNVGEDVPLLPLSFFSGRGDPPTRMVGKWGLPPPCIPGYSGFPAQLWEPTVFRSFRQKRQGNAMPGCCVTILVTQFLCGGGGCRKEPSIPGCTNPGTYRAWITCFFPQTGRVSPKTGRVSHVSREFYAGE
jgi:hypothetical protein